MLNLPVILTQAKAATARVAYWESQWRATAGDPEKEAWYDAVVRDLHDAATGFASTVTALEEAQVLFTQYGNHHSSCILEHHAPDVRDCGCGYISALRAILGESK
ncbi:hypothetical protein LCGC14_1716140 [marine sediment metagenome]|uniref:Uncharacterized protein n=1 Tax=marine sediment metagenome TaxID=412755 RepID=A0A0F9KDR2_9ZZZZ